MSEIVVDSDHFSEFSAGGSSLTVSPQGISIQSLYRSFRDGSLIVNRQYQRKLVWTVSEKQRLIDSILKDYPLPLFLLADKNGLLEVIDGMQRLNAIFSYIEQGFLLENKCFNINEFARARQAAEKKLFEEYPEDVERLSAQQCSDMLDYQISETIRHAERSGAATVEPSLEAEDGWTKTCEEIANMTLFPKVDSWIFGANIPGKKNTVMFYMAGIGAYRQELEAVRNEGYKGFVFS
jgi:Protein of unknown function DUF262